MATHIITIWPLADRIPGLDLYRLLTFATPEITTTYLNTLNSSSPLIPQSPTTATPNTSMLALRSIANLFAHTPGRVILASSFPHLWPLAASFMFPPSSKSASPVAAAMGTSVEKYRNVHIAVVTAAINYAVLFSSSPPPTAIDFTTKSHARTLTGQLAAFLMDPKVIDSETVYRALVALGTLLMRGDDFGLGSPKESDQREGAADADAEARGRAVDGALGRVERSVCGREPRVRALIAEMRALL